MTFDCDHLRQQQLGKDVAGVLATMTAEVAGRADVKVIVVALRTI
jgi:hypothetical protein